MGTDFTGEGSRRTIIDDMCKYMYYDYWFRQYETILQLYETQYDSLKSFGVKYHGIDPTGWSRFKGLFPTDLTDEWNKLD